MIDEDIYLLSQDYKAIVITEMEKLLGCHDRDKSYFSKFSENNIHDVGATSEAFHIMKNDRVETAWHVDHGTAVYASIMASIHARQDHVVIIKSPEDFRLEPEIQTPFHTSDALFPVLLDPPANLKFFKPPVSRRERRSQERKNNKHRH